MACLRREQDQDLRAFQVVFDQYFLESSLYDSGAVENRTALCAAGHSYDDEDALWLRTTDFGDDKDRVMRKREGGYTYFVPDVAYHHNKWERGFERVINEQGADHHSTITGSGQGCRARCRYYRRLARIRSADGDGHARWRRGQLSKLAVMSRCVI